MQVKDIVRAMETLAPIHLKEDWDNVGLQIGGPEDKADRVLLALTPSEKVVEEAVERGCDMIVTHHPFIFKGVKTLRTDTVIGRMSHACIKHDIALYCAHTNLDIAQGGVNDVLAARLGLVNVRGLQQTAEAPRYKVVVFVPMTHAEAVKAAMFHAGAGAQGNYEFCAWSVVGNGQFAPKSGANPYLGEIGKVETVEETRLEVLVERAQLHAVIDAMLRAHPYEEVAYDIFVNKGSATRAYLGRIGELPSEMRLSDWLLQIKDVLNVPVVSVAGDAERMVKTVALCGGSACELLDDAKRAGGDVFITGDMKYHDAQRAIEMGMTMVDVSHFGGERPVLSALQSYLTETFNEGLCIEISEKEESFIKYIK